MGQLPVTLKAATSLLINNNMTQLPPSHDNAEPWKRTRDDDALSSPCLTSSPNHYDDHDTNTNTTKNHHGHRPNDGNRLCGILYLNLEADGHRILLPFLSTMDLLRLSECSKYLSGYRTFVTRFKVVWHPWAHFMLTSRLKRGLIRLLTSAQQSVDLLRLEDKSVVTVLDDLVAADCCNKVKTLDLSQVQLTTKEVACVGRAFAAGGMKGLRSINFSSVSCKRQAARLGRIMEALANGGCPNLCQLDLSRNVWGVGSCHPLANALASGYCHGLEELDLGYTEEMEAGWLLPLSRSLHGCPQLKKLVLSNCSLLPGDGQALAVALHAGSCPKLQDLRLSCNRGLGNLGVAAIMEALEGGACPGLERLELAHLSVTAMGGLALACALASKKLGRLQWLEMGGFCTDAPAALQIMQALKDGACPHLRRWSVAENGVNLWQGLAEAIEARALPQLRVLVLSGSMSMGDYGVMHVARALEGGGSPRLEELHLSHVGLGSVGGKALAKAFASGSLSALRVLNLLGNRSVGDKAMAGVVKALASGSCPHLMVLHARGTFMSNGAGQALIQSLRDNAWPHLQELVIDNESKTANWMCELADTLADGAGGRLETLSMVSFSMEAKGFLRLAQVLEKGALPCLKKLWLGTVLGAYDLKVAGRELKRSMMGRKAEVVVGRRHGIGYVYV